MKKYIIVLLFSVGVINGFSQDTVQNKAIAPILKEYWNSIYSFNKLAAQRIGESFEVYFDFHKDAFNYITKGPTRTQNQLYEESVQDRLTGEWLYTISTPFQEKQTGRLIISQKNGDLFFAIDDNSDSGEIPMRHQSSTTRYIAADTIEQMNITVKYSFLLVTDDFLQITVSAGNIRYLINAKKENVGSENE